MSRPWIALVIGLLLRLPAASSASAQSIALRFIGADMYGGLVVPAETDVGFAFGTRIGLLEIPGRAIRAGLVIDWWAADHSGLGLEVRDIVSGVDFWKDFGNASWFRPFAGVGTAVHAADVSRMDGSVAPLPSEAQELDGVRLGVSAFGGVTVRITHTGAIWSILEYRYNAVPDIANHEIRAGLRLLIRGG